MNRYDGRNNSQPRQCTIQTDFVQTADGSCLVSTGKTKVICTACVQESVPPFLRDQGTGWITAEYAMLPASTGTRKKRDGLKKDGRGVEIQRLIGRALRQAVDLEKLGERTITLDCDVLQADGGTRTASITGAFVALALAVDKLIKENVISENPIKAQIAAISVGVVYDEPMLDLCYIEDSNAQTDMNLVANQKGEFIELQGTGEKSTFSRTQLDKLILLGNIGIFYLMKCQREALSHCSSLLLPPPRLVVATRNKHKLTEMKDILGGMFELVSTDDIGFTKEIEENGNTFEENATIKSETIMQYTGLPVIADDSGLMVDALNGAPGINSARYGGEHGNNEKNCQELLKNMEKQDNRKCCFVCAIALSIPQKSTVVTVGKCEGTLLNEYKGNSGFGYDPLFLYEDRTFAQMSQKEKNAVSHRSKALLEMKKKLMEIF